MRALVIFCFRHGVLLMQLYFKGIFLKSHWSHFTKNRIWFSCRQTIKKCKKLPHASMTSVCNKGTQWGGFQKNSIYHICIFDNLKQDLVISHNWCNKYAYKLWSFYESWSFGLYILPFFIHTWQDLYLPCSCFPGANFLRMSNKYNKVLGRQHDLPSADN